ncbi:PQQ-binding-like beta-propeller repeat protein [Heyndrickxia sporothermodurans]|uniref:outer membrane protein assembly factor BamB family protein n=1 Tax=Heyndrickxia sporothermodurans TaxID=46224 RepID=UPI002E1F948A|nr:PQQ-binding-like beta-propeller repeat protein [Heyndrickxia sporothermodurans]MED3697598.1 PQQ-binding-like beta-propeller repeat protein [Heyndrickxia sporothermodurans]
MRRYLKVIGIALLALVLVVGCQSKTDKNKNNANNQAAKNNNETGFPNWGYDYQQTRHVPYDKITKDNVKKLGIVWQKDLADWDPNVPNASEDFPVVKDGVIYVTTSYNRVFAMDASTGKKIWSWKPPKEVQDHFDSAKMEAFSIIASRGVAVAEGNVFVLIADNRLAKLDAKNGKLVKMINLWDTIKGATLENRYYETNAPMYYKGNIYVGSSGGDSGGFRGFVMAFKASDLTPAWEKPFYTVPEKGKGWMKGKYTGGGAVWCPMSFDPDTDMMYFGVGNPAPDYFKKVRPGTNPHTDSVVALDSKTGKLIWAKSEVDEDEWDYDAGSTPMVVNAKVGNKKRKAVVHGGKNGKWYAWDAKTGDTIYDGVPFVKIKHTSPPTDKNKAVLQWPGTEGGQNYAPETYDPKSNYVLIPGINKPSLSVGAKDISDIEERDGLFPGTEILPTPKDVEISGTITAIDMNTGKKAYQNKTKQPMRGGFTSTATGLAFYGELDGTVNALDIKSGKVLWNMNSGGAQIMMAPSIYVQDGKQYVVYVSGTKVIAYGLGGNKTVTPAKDPQGSGKETEANHGSSGNKEKDKKQPANNSVNAEAIYKKSCASCHGGNLEGSVGPDISHVGRTMSEEDILNQIINGSGRMPGNLVKGDQAKALAKWLSQKK